jgi:hypothetical protein
MNYRPCAYNSFTIIFKEKIVDGLCMLHELDNQEIHRLTLVLGWGCEISSIVVTMEIEERGRLLVDNTERKWQRNTQRVLVEKHLAERILGRFVVKMRGG